MAKRKPTLKEKIHIVSFSGGKDSTAMLLMMLERGIKVDEVVFVDTTKEFPETYKNIEKVVKYIEPIPFIQLKLDFDYYFKDYQKKFGNHLDHKGYGWPDISYRWCTGLKQKIFLKHVRKYGSHNVLVYVGIAADEAHRSRNTVYYPTAHPLIEWGITEREALEYCYKKGFDWDGFYNKFDHASCYCCPLQRAHELRIIYEQYPELWADMKRLDSYSHRTFKKDTTLQQFEDRFKVGKSGEERTLFDG